MGETEQTNDMCLVFGDKRAVIVTGSKSTSLEQLEQHAAHELQNYLQRISGIQLKIVKESELPPSAEYIILVGRRESCELLQVFTDKGVINLSQDFPGGDGFILKTLFYKGKHYLIMGGGNNRGVIYAVYHFLENVLHCGFFEDGEYIPSMKQVVVKNVNLIERPYFPYRSFLQGCAQSYTTPYWSLEEWQREIDWLVKKKINMMYFSIGLVRGPRVNSVKPDIVARRTWKAFGLDYNIEEDEETRLAQNIIQYARQRGIQIVNVPSFNGGVPDEFKEKYPQCKYITTQWEETEPVLNLDPSDPMFAKVVETHLCEYNRLFDTDHRYEFSMYAEMEPGSSRDEGMRLRIDFARSVIKGMKSADPDGIWQLQSWCFRGHPNLTPREVQDLLSVIPDDSVYVCDTWADASPLYKEYKYFYGKTWGFSVLHAMGGNTTLHGDMKGIIEKVKDIIVDPQANLCKYFTIIPEVIRHNPLYYELLMKLSWNPMKVDLDSFLYDYALRRYGEVSLDNMNIFLNCLAESVYSVEDWTGPQYQWAPGLERPTNLDTRFPFIPYMYKALRIALKEKDNQGGNPLYQRDLLDVCRQYLGDLFNYHWVKLDKAYYYNKEADVEHEGNVMCDILRKQAELLSLHPDYRLDTEIQRAIAAGFKPKVAERIVKARFTYLGILVGLTWDKYPFLLDYARRDLAELIQYYYLPRICVYINSMKHNLARAKAFPFYPIYPTNDLVKHNKDIAYDFVEKPLPESVECQWKSIAEAVEGILAEL